jgi:hypothetical protein
MYIYQETVYFSSKEMNVFRKFTFGEEPKNFFKREAKGIMIQSFLGKSYLFESEPIIFYASQIIQMGLAKSIIEPEKIWYINVPQLIGYLRKLYTEREENPETKMKFEIRDWEFDIMKPFKKIDIHNDTAEYKISIKSKGLYDTEFLKEPLWEAIGKAIHEINDRRPILGKIRDLFINSAEFNTYKI